MIMADQPLPLANQTWLESSLLRSARLGRQVLDRASRRRGAAGEQDWWTRPSCTTSQSKTPSSTTEDCVTQTSVQRTHLDSAFETIAEFMVHTADQCKNVYQSDCCSDPTEWERKHVHRFHSQPSTRTATPALPKRIQGQVSPVEDFHIEVYPGTYSISAGMQDSLQQTQMVSINAGQSINLTFNL